jgi:hypothetical protein
MLTGLWNMGPRLRGDDSMRTDESAVYRALGAHDHRGSPGGMQALDGVLSRFEMKFFSIRARNTALCPLPAPAGLTAMRRRRTLRQVFV